MAPTVEDLRSARLQVAQHKPPQSPPRGAGDGPRALSVSMLSEWLGQDRLSGVLASEAILGGE